LFNEDWRRHNKFFGVSSGMIRRTDRQDEHGSGKQAHKKHSIMQITDETREAYADKKP
jgi:hypothetical protein